MAGRPPKPTALKRLAGNPGRRPLPAEPDYVVGAEPPKWLSRQAKAVWRELAPILLKVRVLTEADAQGLAVLCCLQARFIDECRRPGGAPSSRLAGEIRQYLGRFGLTPADRARISAAPAAEEADPFAEFDGKLKVVPGGKAR